MPAGDIYKDVCFSCVYSKSVDHYNLRCDYRPYQSQMDGKTFPKSMLLGNVLDQAGLKEVRQEIGRGERRSCFVRRTNDYDPSAGQSQAGRRSHLIWGKPKPR